MNTEHDSPKFPLISAILAVRNEARHIEAVLKSLLEQDTPGFNLEIIVVDGESSDGTREIVERIIREVPRVKLVLNKNQTTPFAFNLGILHARGEYICILGAHTAYAKNYISVCFDELREKGAVGCSGRVITRPGNNGLEARLVAWALGHPFGTSNRSVRTLRTGFVETIPYPVFLKSALIEVGGYDIKLDRNQDNDISQKLRARGYKLYLTGDTSCNYFANPSVSSLVRYAFKTGYWNWISLRQNANSMSVRHFVPLAFLLSLSGGFASFVVSWLVKGNTRLWMQSPFVLLCATYLFSGMIAACHVAIRERSFVALLLPPLFFVLHVTYGSGTLWALLTNARVAPIARDRERTAGASFDQAADRPSNQAPV